MEEINNENEMRNSPAAVRAPKRKLTEVEPDQDEANANSQLLLEQLESARVEANEEGEDNSDEEDEEEEEEEKQESTGFDATPVIKDKDLTSSKTSSCGIIKEIECLDFMCHKHMSVKLGDKINFITGQNGSGKSAVIAALQICLGMQARDTHRASKLSSLIRHGSRANAIVRVTLSNEGVDAFQPEKYGDRITVERTIRRVGGAGYKLLSHEGKVVSTKKTDLDEIRDRFNLFVENPCCILDQENSKMFLKGNASQKYKLFLKATELEKMISNYTHEKEVRQANEQELKDRKKELPALKSKLLAAQNALEDLQRMETLKKQLDETNNEKVWAIVEEYKSEMENEAQKLAKAEDKLDKSNKKYQDAILKKEEKNLENEGLNNIVKESLAKLEENKAAQNRANSNLKQALGPRMDLSRQLNAHDRQIKQYEKQRNGFAKELETLRQRAISRDVESEKKEIHIEMKKATEQKDVALEECETYKHEEISTRNHIDELESELNEAKKQHGSSKRDLKSTMQDHEELLATVDDSSARYGKWLPSFLKEIDRHANSFHRKPIHVGLNVELKNMEYWRPVELCLGGLLNSFIVNDGHDYSMLKKLASKNRVPSIKINLLKFLDKRHNTHTRTVDGRLTTIEKVISVKDDNVFNCLVDLASVEGMVLVENTNDAMTETFIGPKGNKSMPKGMKKCYNKNGDLFQVKGGSEVKIANNNRMSEPRYFSDDVTSQIGPCKERIRTLEFEVKSHADAIKERQTTLKEKRKKLTTLQQEQKRRVNLCSQLENTLAGLSQKVMSFENDETEVEINELTSNIKEIDESIEDIKEKHEKTKEALSKVEEKILPLKEKLDSIKDDFSKLSEEAEAARKQLSTFEEEYNPFVINVAKYKAQVEKRQNTVLQFKLSHEEKANRFEQGEAAALDYTKNKRYEPTETAEKLTKKITQLTKKMEAEAKRLQKCNADPVVMLKKAQIEVDRREKAVAARVNALKIIKARIKRLKSASKERIEKWWAFRSHVQRVTSHMFNYYLSQRDHAGDVNFDNDKGEITFSWSKNAGDDKEKAATDTRQLSGGEKSFTTLAFLLALGKVIECPFRVMDEFDVFMDAGNRKTAMQILIGMARDKASNSQFIFITPNDISMIDDAKDVRKLRMNPPEKDYGGRHTQSTLNFQRER